MMTICNHYAFVHVLFRAFRIGRRADIMYARPTEARSTRVGRSQRPKHLVTHTQSTVRWGQITVGGRILSHKSTNCTAIHLQLRRLQMLQKPGTNFLSTSGSSALISRYHVASKCISGVTLPARHRSYRCHGRVTHVMKYRFHEPLVVSVLTIMTLER